MPYPYDTCEAEITSKLDTLIARLFRLKQPLWHYCHRRNVKAYRPGKYRFEYPRWYCDKHVPESMRPHENFLDQQPTRQKGKKEWK